MGYRIEITENKVNEMSEIVEKMLKNGGKLMHCIDEMREDKYGRMGHRSPMPAYRDNWAEDDDDRYGERHGGRRGDCYRYLYYTLRWGEISNSLQSFYHGKIQNTTRRLRNEA